MYYKTLPEISKRQSEIVDLVYRFRFINRAQIQRYFNHKDPKRINVWLKDLVNKGYLGRIYSKKLLENTKPAIYYLSNFGILWTKDKKGEEYRAENWELEFKYLKKFYEDKHASQSFINHGVNLFECFLQFKQKEKNSNGKLEYFCETKTELWIQNQLFDRHNEFEEIKNYLPDIFIERFSNPETDQETSTTFFLELIDPHVPRYAIRYKISQFIQFHDEESGKKHKRFTGWDKRLPTVLLIFPDQRKLNSMARYIRRQLDDQYIEEMFFHLSTFDKLKNNGLEDASIWKEIKAE